MKIAQIVYHEISEMPKVSYDKKEDAKYNNQGSVKRNNQRERIPSKCLNKNYAGFTADIQTIQSQLTLLTMWITQAQCEQVRENTYRILNKV